MNKLNFSLGFIFVICLLISAPIVSAATRTVDNTTDNGALSACTSAANDCSLRGAIDGAASGDTINFASSPFGSPQTIVVNSYLFIDKNLTINGTGARNLNVARNTSSANDFEVFRIGDGTVRISGILVTNGTDSGIFNSGTVTLDGMHIAGNLGNIGGIFNAGTMTILNSLITSNTAFLYGAGIYNGGTLTIANTTITGNTVGGNGGGGAGIDNTFSTLNMNNVTITGNANRSTDPDSTGGVLCFGSTTNIRNTIISGNLADSTAYKDVYGDFTSNGNNLVTVTIGSTGFTQPTDITGSTASLGALQNNGGLTDTRLPTATSLTVNRGNNCVVNQMCGANNPPVPLTTDQRGAGFSRRSGASVDIGAAESPFNPTAAGASVGGRVTETNNRGIFRALITMTDSQGNQRTAYTNQLGYYHFEDVAGGQVYVFTAQHRRYQFDQPTQVQFIGEETNQINFTGTANGIFRFDIWNVPTKGDN